MPRATGPVRSGQQPRRGGGVRPRRDFEALTARRMRAAEVFARGQRQVDVLTELGVSAQTASRWHRAFAGLLNTESLIGFLEDLHSHLAGGKITLIWDNLPAHKSRAMTAWLATQRRWLRAERLPGYAHDLNPVELVWGNVKA